MVVIAQVCHLGKNSTQFFCPFSKPQILRESFHLCALKLVAKLLLVFWHGNDQNKSGRKHEICCAYLWYIYRGWPHCVFLLSMAFRFFRCSGTKGLKCSDTGNRDLFCIKTISKSATGISELFPGNERGYQSFGSGYVAVCGSSFFYFPT